jgi:hypothetical protein
MSGKFRVGEWLESVDTHHSLYLGWVSKIIPTIIHILPFLVHPEENLAQIRGRAVAVSQFCGSI